MNNNMMSLRSRCIKMLNMEEDIKKFWYDVVYRECEYFRFNKSNTYGKLSLINTEILNRKIGYFKYDILLDKFGLPKIYENLSYFYIPEIPLNEIEILSKEEFVSGLKKELQDALDNM